MMILMEDGNEKENGSTQDNLWNATPNIVMPSTENVAEAFNIDSTDDDIDERKTAARGYLTKNYNNVIDAENTEGNSSPKIGGLWNATKNMLVSVVDIMAEEIDEMIDGKDLGEDEYSIFRSDFSENKALYREEAHDKNELKSNQDNSRINNFIIPHENKSQEFAETSSEDKETEALSPESSMVDDGISLPMGSNLWNVTKNMLVSAVEIAMDNQNDELKRDIASTTNISESGTAYLNEDRRINESNSKTESISTIFPKILPGIRSQGITNTELEEKEAQSVPSVKNVDHAVRKKSKQITKQDNLWDFTRNICVATLDIVTEELDDLFDEVDLYEEERSSPSPSSNEVDASYVEEEHFKNEFITKQDTITRNISAVMYQNTSQELNLVDSEDVKALAASLVKYAQPVIQQGAKGNNSSVKQDSLWSFTRNILVTVAETITEEFNNEFTEREKLNEEKEEECIFI